MKAARKFDVIVIGAGSGLEISSDAASRGLKVAVVEKGPFGGTCLNRGCIPSKMLIHSADVMETVQKANKFGIRAKVAGVDWKRIIGRVNKTIDEEAAMIEHGNRQTSKIAVYKAQAKFVGPKQLDVGKEVITAAKIFICAGTRPFVPKIPGLDSVPYMTSDEALRLKKQPKHLIIIGGGYISAELAHFYGTLGTKITIIQRSGRLMTAEDSELAQRFTEVYQRRFNVLLNSTTDKVYRKGKGIAVEVSVGRKKKRITGDALLVATGRVPNSDILNVKATGVLTDERGFVKVNEYLETSVPGIRAIGDIAGVFQFKHSANLEAAYASNNAFNPKKPVPYQAMPHAAFTSPQVAGVGYTEDELKKQNLHYVKSVYEYKDTAYGASIQDNDGFVKVLADPETKEILGCHIIGTHASMLIHEVVVAMRAGLGVQGILNAVHIHPALNEVVQRAFGSIE
ncbi:dihydrolipoyl dehydrogenase [Candidatus Woesearchaeota archaeon]|nr:dihydrolipoyl dehydrogenase [Candidatus Woesearchaeota archaeon]